MLVGTSGLAFGVLSAGTAFASPQGGAITGGQGAIHRPDAHHTVIDQRSSSLAIDWRSFNLSRGDVVRFHQPSASAAALNRIMDQNPSTILGTIKANGRVFLINPNGLIFGRGARINVGSLVAGTLDISPDDFMRGDYHLEAPPGTAPGVVINRGLIQAATGGSVTLVGGAVSNEGLILARYGHVNLGAGRAATLDFNGDGLLRFRIDEGVLGNAEGSSAAVSNRGTIDADGGQVLLTGRQSRHVFSQVINNSGVVRAGRIQRQGGVIRLVAGPSGSVVNTGTLDASARTADHGGAIVVSAGNITQSGRIHADGAAGGSVSLAAADAVTLDGDSVNSARAGTGRGGTITIRSGATTKLTDNASIDVSSDGARGGTVQVLGHHVGLFDTASIHADGATGGGEILVGGDAHGAGTVATASATVMAPGASLSADATEDGDGGKVVLWSDDYTRFAGNISARGGASDGNGGWVETSSRENLQAFGTVDASARRGDAGDWLLDPADVTICSATTCTSNGAFNGADPNVFAPDTGVNTAQLSVDDITSGLNAGTDVTVTTTNNGSAGGSTGTITVAAQISGGDSDNVPTLTLNADDSIVFNSGAGIDPNGKSLNVVLNAARTNPAGAISFESGSTGIDTGASGILTMSAGTGGIDAANGALIVGGLSSFTTAGTGAIALDNPGNELTGAISFTAVGGDVTLYNGKAAKLAASNVGGALGVTSDSAITINGEIKAGGTATFSAGTDMSVLADITGSSLTLKIGQGGAGSQLSFGSVTLNASKVTVLGGAGADVFSFGGLNPAPAPVTVAGGGGVNTLKGAGAYNLTGQNSGNASLGEEGEGASLSFSSVQNLSSSGPTTFTMSPNGSVDGDLTASGGTIDYGGYGSAVTFDLADSKGKTTGIGGTWSGITKVTGSGHGDTLKGDGATYGLTAKDAGKSGGVSWTSFENISDAGAATFNMHSGADGSVSGNLSASGGTIDYGGYGSAVSFDLGNGTGKTTGIGGTWSGIAEVTGNSNGTTVRGDATGDTFTVQDAGGGTVTYNDGSSGLDFSSVDELAGGTGSDTFVLYNGVSGGIDGGGDDDALTIASSFTAPASGLDIDNVETISNSIGAVLTVQSLDVTGVASFGLTAADLDALAVTGPNATVNIENDGPLELRAINIGGDLNVTTTGGAITQSGTLKVTGTSTFNAGTRAIKLGKSGNEFTGAVTALGDDIEIDATNDLTIASLTAGGTVGLSASGSLRLPGLGSSGDPLTGLALNAGALILGGDLHVGNVLDFTHVDSITLAGDVIVDTSAANGAQNFSGVPIDSDVSGARTLVLKSGSGAITLDQAGQARELAGLTIAANGATRLNGDIRTGTSARFDGPVTLGQSLDIIGGTIHFAGSIDAAAADQQGLTLNAGSGGVTIDGPVGAGQRLAFLRIDGAGSNLLSGDITTAGALDLSAATGTTTLDLERITAGGSVQLGGPLVLGRDLSVTAGDHAIEFNGPIIANSGHKLSLDAGTGTLSLHDTGTAADPLGGLTLTGGSLTLAGDVFTRGGLDFGSVHAVEIAAPVVLDTSVDEGNQSFGTSTLDGPGALTLRTGGGDVVLATIGTTSAPGALTISGGDTNTLNGSVHVSGPIDIDGTTQLNGGTIITDGGDIGFNGAVHLGADTDMRSNGGAFALGGAPVTGAGYHLSLDAGGGDVVLGPIGTVSGPLAQLLVSGAGRLDLTGDIFTGKAVDLSANGDVNQSGNIDSGGGEVHLDTANGDITMTAGTATRSHGGDINYTADDGSVIVGQLDAGAGDVAVNALGGDILSNGTTPNVTASAARFDALGAIGEHDEPIGFEVPADGSITLTLGAAAAYISNDSGALVISDSPVVDIAGQILASAEKGQAASLTDLGYVDWSAFSPDLRLFGISGSGVLLPPDQRDE